MDKATYDFAVLEKKYNGFLVPSVKLIIGGTEIDATEVPVPTITVDIDAGKSAGGAQVTIEGMYDLENSKWLEKLLDTIEIGEVLEIQAGYSTKKLIFFGYIDSVNVNYSGNAIPQISFTGIDASGYLMNPDTTNYHEEKTQAAVAKKILETCVNEGYAKKLDFGDSDIPDFETDTTQNEMSDYQWLSLLAERSGVNFFVVQGVLVYKNIMSYSSPIITLKLGSSLLSFSRSKSTNLQIGKVIVTSVNKDKEISGEATSSTLPGSGKDAASTASKFKTVTKKIQVTAVNTAELCKKIAQNIFNKYALQYVSGRGRCIGIPELIPGRYIKLEGMDKASNATYFIDKVTHKISASEGYITEFSVKGAKSQ
jgi:phage protein D